jgi:hypothetical protein
VTASVTMLPEVTARIGPARALAVPYALGYPFGQPGDRAGQHAVLASLLALCEETGAPVLRRFERTGET